MLALAGCAGPDDPQGFNDQIDDAGVPLVEANFMAGCVESTGSGDEDTFSQPICQCVYANLVDNAERGYDGPLSFEQFLDADNTVEDALGDTITNLGDLEREYGDTAWHEAMDGALQICDNDHG